MPARKVALLCLAASAAAAPSGGSGMTCGDLQGLFDAGSCTGALDELVAPCPYNFAKPDCDNAEPQSPRDLMAGATGSMKPKAATLTEAQAMMLPLVNVHFHLGAEHRAEDYSDAADSEAYDAARRRLGESAHDAGRRLGESVRPGFMCAAASGDELASYTFEHCKGQVEVGKSYEVHYVHSSAGYAAEDIAGADFDIDDGLGGAANGRGMLNPMIVVQAQVFQVVHGGAGENVTDMDLLHGWTVVDHSNSVKYAGSTTGPSHNNEVCSPYAITWHVDKTCHKVSPAAFDNLCKQMKDTYNLEQDLYPHGSRILLDSKYVVQAQYVKALSPTPSPTPSPADGDSDADGAARVGPARILTSLQTIYALLLSPILYRGLARA